MGDMGLLIASIVAEISIDVAHQAAAHAVLAWIPYVGWAIAIGRIVWRELFIHQQLNQKIIDGVRGQLRELEHSHAAKIRQGIKKDFVGLKQKVAGSIDEEIALIDSSLQSILDRKRQGELRADQERHRLDAARSRIAAATNRIQNSAVIDNHEGHRTVHGGGVPCQLNHGEGFDVGCVYAH